MIKILSYSYVTNIDSYFDPFHYHLFCCTFFYFQIILLSVFYPDTLMSFVVYPYVFLFLTTPFILYLHQIFDTANWEQSRFFVTFHNAFFYDFYDPFHFINWQFLLLEIQPLVEVCKNCLLIVDQFEYKLQDNSIFFSEHLVILYLPLNSLGKNITLILIIWFGLLKEYLMKSECLAVK